jgi:Tol biopolymer transport system component
LLVGLSALAVVHFREKTPQSHPVRFQIAMSSNLTPTEIDGFDISPDGRTLAFTAFGPDRVKRLWIRDLSELAATPLSGSENPVNTFFWSSDSHFIVFQSGGKIRRIAIAGGPARTLCDAPDGLIGGFSSANGSIVFGTTGAAIYRVAPDGGTPEALTRAEPSRQETYHAMPVPLPDGRHFLYLRVSSNPEYSGIFVASLDGKPDDPLPRMLLATGFGVRFVPTLRSNVGHLLFLRDGTLLSQELDLDTMQLTGAASPVANHVSSFFVSGFFTASTNGTIVYRTGGTLSRQVTWFDRTGMKTEPVGEPDSYVDVAVAPDGLHGMATRVDSQTNLDLWLLDFRRGIHSRFAFGRFRLFSPVWSSDGRRVVFASNEHGPVDLFEKAVGSEESGRLLFKSNDNKTPTSMSHDRELLLFHTNPSSDLWLLPLSGDTAKPVSLLKTQFNERDGQFSPDGRWIAYQSDESGRLEISVRAFRPEAPEQFASAPSTLVSRNGGIHPRWRGDGRELFYQSGDGKLMTVAVSQGAAQGTAFQAANPLPLFTFPPNAVTAAGTSVMVWEPAPDGQRFLMLLPPADTTQTPFTVLLNWAAN